MIIRDARYQISCPNSNICPDTDVPEYAFIGRSNVGKSSLINMITGRKNLAKTSQTPGKTLLINFFNINDGEWYLVDLPGYGYAARGRKQKEDIQRMIEDYILNRQQMTCLFLLIDSRHAPQKIDIEFMKWLGENSVPFAIVFTKLDKLSASAANRNIQAYKKDLMQYWEELPPIFATSSENRTGRDDLLEYIESINREISSKTE